MLKRSVAVVVIASAIVVGGLAGPVGSAGARPYLSDSYDVLHGAMEAAWSAGRRVPQFSASSRGMWKRSAYVKPIQRWLNTTRAFAIWTHQRWRVASGWEHVTIDGDFGTRTRRAVIGYQKLHKLNVTGGVNGTLLEQMKKECGKLALAMGNNPTPACGRPRGA